LSLIDHTQEKITNGYSGNIASNQKDVIKEEGIKEEEEPKPANPD